MNWRIKIVIAAWLIAVIPVGLLIRNLMRDGWKDLPVVSLLLLSIVLLFFSSSYLLLRGARRNSK